MQVRCPSSNRTDMVPLRYAFEYSLDVFLGSVWFCESIVVLCLLCPCDLHTVHKWCFAKTFWNRACRQRATPDSTFVLVDRFEGYCAQVVDTLHQKHQCIGVYC